MKLDTFYCAKLNNNQSYFKRISQNMNDIILFDLEIYNDWVYDGEVNELIIYAR